MISAFEKVYGPCYEDEKKQTLKELRALLLTYPASRKVARSYILNAIRFIEQE